VTGCDIVGEGRGWEFRVRDHRTSAANLTAQMSVTVDSWPGGATETASPGSGWPFASGR
jgi:hypothetical protein